MPGRLGLPRSGSGFGRDSGVDGEGVNSTRHQGVQRIIYEAMPGDAAEAIEAPADDAHAEVPSFTGACVAGVQMAVVLHLELGGRQGCSERGFDLGRRHAHVPSPEIGGLAASASRASATFTYRATASAWPIMNSSISPLRPKTLKLAQVEVE